MKKKITIIEPGSDVLDFLLKLGFVPECADYNPGMNYDYGIINIYHDPGLEFGGYEWHLFILLDKEILINNPTPELIQEIVDKYNQLKTILEENNDAKKELEDYDRCHMCNVPTDCKCSFDVEMNPHSNPRPCCGQHNCHWDI